MSEGADLERARAAKALAVTRLAGLAQVNGVGITRVGQGYGVKINLTEQLDPGTTIPDEISGVPVVVEFVGRISPRASRP